MTFLFPKGQSRLLQHILAQKWDDAVFQLHKNPREAKRFSRITIDSEVTEGGKTRDSHVLPLHQAVALNPPMYVVQHLLAAYPGAAHEVESYFSRHPLHIACQKGCSPEVIDLLIRANDRAVGMKDGLGRVPLHYAVFSHSPLDTVQSLLESRPECARVADTKGWLPIHVAIRFGVPTKVVELMTRAYPQCVNSRTVKGMTPLRVAEKFGLVRDPVALSLLRRGIPSGMVTHDVKQASWDASTRANAA